MCLSESLCSVQVIDVVEEVVYCSFLNKPLVPYPYRVGIGDDNCGFSERGTLKAEKKMRKFAGCRKGTKARLDGAEKVAHTWDSGRRYKSDEDLARSSQIWQDRAGSAQIGGQPLPKKTS
ncbi:hypothetical protein LWI28_014605 [Acer negundo]|uniref:Uncharacterized protein n=1 Tax=Acer negundo TaxID=4023 RepID=A0AAD5JJM7_ACENE|nr:hypothetical protein LWI28_014605 [Acer negundo]